MESLTVLVLQIQLLKEVVSLFFIVTVLLLGLNAALAVLGSLLNALLSDNVLVLG